MPILGTPRKLHERFKFLVHIDGVESAAFQKCSELSVEVADISYWEGGALIPIKDPGRLTFADVTLERGASQNRDFFNWARQVANATIAVPMSTALGSGLPSPAFKRDMAILQLDRDNTILREWSLYGGWPKKFVAGEWDNTADEVVIESLVVCYDQFELR